MSILIFKLNITLNYCRIILLTTIFKTMRFLHYCKQTKKQGYYFKEKSAIKIPTESPIEEALV